MNKREQDRSRDLIDCPGESYHIERRICEARRRRGYKHCRKCAENTDHISLFESPRQIIERKKRGRKKIT